MESTTSENEMIERNIELSAEFSRYLFEHPELEERIPSDAEIILIPQFDDELRRFNMQLGREIEADGRKITYIDIKQMRRKNVSRLRGVKLVSLK